MREAETLYQIIPEMEVLASENTVNEGIKSLENPLMSIKMDKPRFEP